MNQLGLKLCLVFILTINVFALVVACSGAPLAESWARSACRVVEALPSASSSVPSGKEMHIVISATSASVGIVDAEVSADVRPEDSPH